MFKRGYKECREKLSSNPSFSRSCFNCVYYYQAVGDKEEVCQNSEVLEYDMVVDANLNSVYCLKWTPSSVSRKKKEELFRRSGRALLD